MEHLLILEKEEENRRVGLLASIAIHLLLLLICLLPFFSFPDPPPQESGVLVSFGTIDFSADAEPAASSTDEIAEASTEKEESKSEPTPQKEKVKKDTPAPAKKKEITSDVTEDVSPVVVNNKSESKDEISDEVAAAQAEKEAQERAEAEAKRKAAEAQRKADAEAAARKKAYENSKKNYGDLFSSGSGTKPAGQQGDPNGDPNAKALEGLSTGNGMIGGGLSGRDVVYEPVVNDSSQKTGKVVIKVCVDPSGQVIESEFTQKGSTTTDRHLVAKAHEGAKKYKFTKNDKELQCGTITFDFKLK